jgi:hypothetical protein
MIKLAPKERNRLTLGKAQEIKEAECNKAPKERNMKSGLSPSKNMKYKKIALEGRNI